MELFSKAAKTKGAALAEISMLLFGVPAAIGLPASATSGPSKPKGKLTPTTPHMPEWVGFRPATNWPGNAGLSRRDKHRAAVAAAKPQAPGPKFKRVRKHKQHVHPLRDEHGAMTLVGATHQATHQVYGYRRVWLGGISAQRGY